MKINLYAYIKKKKKPTHHELFRMDRDLKRKKTPGKLKEWSKIKRNEKLAHYHHPNRTHLARDAKRDRPKSDESSPSSSSSSSSSSPRGPRIKVPPFCIISCRENDRQLARADENRLRSQALWTAMKIFIDRPPLANNETRGGIV